MSLSRGLERRNSRMKERTNNLPVNAEIVEQFLNSFIFACGESEEFKANVQEGNGENLNLAISFRQGDSKVSSFNVWPTSKAVLNSFKLLLVNAVEHSEEPRLLRMLYILEQTRSFWLGYLEDCICLGNAPTIDKQIESFSLVGEISYRCNDSISRVCLNC